MRISPNTVVQLVDGENRAEDRLVFINDETGEELTIPHEAWPLLQYAITYLTGDQYGVQMGSHSHDYQPTPLGTDGTGAVISIPRCTCGSVGGFNQ